MRSIDVADATTEEEKPKSSCSFCWIVSSLVGGLVCVAVGVPMTVIFGPAFGPPMGFFFGGIPMGILLLIGLFTGRDGVRSKKWCGIYWFLFLGAGAILAAFYFTVTGCAEFKLLPKSFAAAADGKITMSFSLGLKVSNPNYLEFNLEGIQLSMFYVPTAAGKEEELIGTTSLDKIAVEMNSIYDTETVYTFTQESVGSYATDCPTASLTTELTFRFRPTLTIKGPGYEKDFTPSQSLDFPLNCPGTPKPTQNFPAMDPIKVRVQDGCKMMDE